MAFLCFPAELGISCFPSELGSAVRISHFPPALISLLGISNFPLKLRSLLVISDAVDKGLVDLVLNLVARTWPLDDSMFEDKCLFASLELRIDQVSINLASIDFIQVDGTGFDIVWRKKYHDAFIFDFTH